MGMSPAQVDASGVHEFLAAADGFAASRGAGKKNAPTLTTSELRDMGIEGFTDG